MNMEEHVSQDLMDIDAAVKKITEFLSTAKGSAYNVCAQLLDIVINSQIDVQSKVFEQTIVLFEDIESDETVQTSVSKSEFRKAELEEQYGELVNSFIDFFVQQKFSSTEFYKNLWNTIQNSMFFPDLASKEFAFYYILIDRRVPYYELSDGYPMSNESFKNLYKKHSALVKKIRYILSTEMKQKTERSSLLLKELGIDLPDNAAPVEEVMEYEKKLILMVEIIRPRREDAVSSVDELIEQLRTITSE